MNVRVQLWLVIYIVLLILFKELLKAAIENVPKLAKIIGRYERIETDPENIISKTEYASGASSYETFSFLQ